MAYEIRTGLRLFGRSPGFALTGALTLGVGIGVVTAMFSVIDRVLINTVPYPEPDRLVVVWNRTLNVGNDQLSLAPGDFVDFRARNRVFEQMAATRSTMLTVTGAGEPEQLPMARVTAGLFQVLGVPPKAGRHFMEDEDRPGGQTVAVVSARLARRLFTTEEAAIGRVLTVEAQPREVIGVMPESFQFPNAECDIWIPLGFGNAERRRGHNYNGIARLKPGVTPEQAQADIQAIAQDLAIRFPDTNRQMRVFLEPLQQTLTGKIRQALLMLLGSVGLVLLMACANVANLLLARASARQKDVALRLALGARRATIVRLFVLESLPLAVIGGGIGLLVAAACLGVLRTLMPASVPGAAEIGLNMRVLLFTVGLSMATCLLVAIVPALRASKTDVVQHLKDAARTTGDRGGLRLRNLLVIGEVALATILLVSAGLLIESFRRLSNVDAGFRTDGLITARLSSMTGIALDVLEFGLLGTHACWPGGDGVCRIGAVRNTALLATQGELILGVDDDVICRPVTTGSADALTIFPSVGSAANRLEPRAAGLDADLPPARVGIFEAHETLLGRHLGSCVRSFLSVELEEGAALCWFARPESQPVVRVTQAGLVGDSARDSPWFLLYVSEYARERLARDDGYLSSALHNREIIQGPTRSVVSARGEVMCYCYGLDNRAVTAPFLPVLRGEDRLFATALSLCTGALQGLIPVAVRHNPTGRAGYSHPDISSSIGGASASWLTEGLVSLAERDYASGPSSPSLLGTTLARIADDDVEFAAWSRNASDRVLRTQAETIGSVLDMIPRHPSQFRHELTLAPDRAERAAEGRGSRCPSDVGAGVPAAAGLQRFRQLTLAYGRLLASWPAACDAAADLRRSNRLLAGA